MMLKKLHEEYGLNIEGIIHKNFKKLGLTFYEANVLLCLFSIPRNRSINITKLSKRLELPPKIIDDALDKLLECSLVTTSLVYNESGKQSEVFSLDNTYAKLEEILRDEVVTKKESTKEKNKQLIVTKLNRPLYDSENIQIDKWYDNGFSEKQVEAAISEVVPPFSVNKVTKALNK